MNVEDILPRDAIPSVDDPEFEGDYFGDPDDEVVVVDGDPPRAYPVRTLSYHEIVNDDVGGTPVAVTWCPICASAAVYERHVEGGTPAARGSAGDPAGDGEDGLVLSFGVSGKLADDALVMYDRQTESEWKQSSGRCIAGELEGRDLRVLPAAFTTWAAFREEHPEGVVLQPVRDESEYPMEPYQRYFEADGFGAGVMRGTGPGRSWDRDDTGPKTPVLGVEREAEAVGYPAPAVAAQGGVVTDTVGDLDVVVFRTDDGLHAFENPGYEFAVADGGFAADGAVWDGSTGASNDDRRLRRVPARRLYAFAWQDDHGPDAFYGF
jgi:hypothetical protein